MEPKFTRLYRFWHWLMAISVIGLLLTVLLRKTFLSYKANAAIIQDKLAGMDIDITIESAKLIAKAIRAPMWEWHYVFGTMLAISIVIRLYMIATKKGVMPLVAIMQAKDGEEKLKQTVYLFLCMGIMIMALSGGVLYFYSELGFTKEGIHWLKELHEFVMLPVLALVVVHWIGVVRHELKTKEGIVSKMIHGDS